MPCIGCDVCCVGCCCTPFGRLAGLVLLIVVFLGWRYIPVGANSISLGYAADMVSLLFNSEVPSYASSWCGGKAELGTCDRRVNFPGPDTTSFVRWEDVWSQGALLPEKEWSGEWWRGNELGNFINNAYFWSGIDISPQSIALGITPRQHAAIRPMMESMWTIGENGTAKYMRAQEIVQRRILEFFQRDEISFPRDTTALVHQILWEVGLNRNVTFEYAKEFKSVQFKVAEMGTVSQLIPARFLEDELGSLHASVVAYIREYVPIVQELYGDQLKDEDCSPSANCTVQAAAALWDTLYAAGGLSVPNTINTGVGILFTVSDSSNPAPGVAYGRDEALQFYWESIRFFPPVGGFPHWTTRPTCAGSTAEETAKLNKPNGGTEACQLGDNNAAGYPSVNQYMGGVREISILALAMSDPRKWGADVAKFRVRPLEDYHSYSVGFAEMAVNENIAGGRMNRACPGKALALLIGSTFFREFDRSLWTLAGDDIAWRGTIPFVGSFVIAKK